MNSSNEYFCWLTRFLAPLVEFSPLIHNIVFAYEVFIECFFNFVIFFLVCFRQSQHAHSLSLRWHAHGTLAKYLMHMAHKSGNTSGVSKSSSDWLNYTGFPGDVCVAFFNVPPGNKDAVTPNPSRKKKAVVFTTVMTSAYHDQLKAGFSKVCEIFFTA